MQDRQQMPDCKAGKTPGARQEDIFLACASRRRRSFCFSVRKALRAGRAQVCVLGEPLAAPESAHERQEYAQAQQYVQAVGE